MGRLPSFGDNQVAVLFSRNEDNTYSSVGVRFRCKILSDKEISNYEPVAGAFTKKCKLFIQTDDLEIELHIHDKVLINGEKKLVSSFGYYMTKARILDAFDFDRNSLIERMPKGISLE